MKALAASVAKTAAARPSCSARATSKSSMSVAGTADTNAAGTSVNKKMRMPPANTSTG